MHDFFTLDTLIVQRLIFHFQILITSTITCLVTHVPPSLFTMVLIYAIERLPGSF